MYNTLSCSTLPYTGRSLADALQCIASLGFTHAELVVRGDNVWPGHIDPLRLADDSQYAESLTSTVQASGLAISSAGCEQSAHLSLAEESRRIEALCAWLARSGATTLTIFVYHNAHPQRWPQLNAIAKHYGITLAAETHLGTATATPSDAIACARTNNLNITLDASHYIGQGFTPQDWEPLISRVSAVQVRHCQPGELQQPTTSISDIRQRLPDLIPAGYADLIVCEQIANAEDPDWTDQLRIT